MSKNSDPWGLYDPRAPGNVSPLTVWDTANRRSWGPAGSPSYETVQQKHDSIRPFYSKTRIQTLPSSSSKWRPPTNYERMVWSQVTSTNMVARDTLNWILNTPLYTNEYVSNFMQTPIRPIQSVVHPRSRAILDDVDFANDLARATTEALLKLKDQKAQVGASLAEAVKTVTHLAQTGKDLWGTYQALRHGKWSELLNILSKRSPLHRRKITAGKTAAQYWLEYNYAWKPLIGEAYGLFELLTQQLEPAMLVHGNRTIYRENEFQRTVQSGGAVGTKYFSRVKTRFGSTVRLTGRIDSTAMRLITQAGIINPLEVLWEVVPFSFVVDWSLPIGNVLQAADATNGLTFVGGSSTQRMQSHVNIDFTPAYTVRGTPVAGVAEIMKFHMVRKALTGFPKPLFYAKSPFSSSHLTSAIALLRQLF